MKLGFVTDGLGYLSFDDMLDTAVRLGIETLEFGCGNWSKAPHINLDVLLNDSNERDVFKQKLNDRNLQIAALNCSGNQLAPGSYGQKHNEVVRKTMQLAHELEVETIVLMSGCPGGGPNDETPNWVTHPILPEHDETLRYQWEDVALPYWESVTKEAKHLGIRKLAIENLGNNLVHNPETLMRLRNEVGPTVGMNFDPSHLFWMGGDPIHAVRYLSDAIHHVHAKDVRIERGHAETNGLIDIHAIDQPAPRSWNYVAMGYGHDLAYWSEFFSVLSMVGYKGPVVLEMEDMTMDPLVGVEKSVALLKQSIPRTFEQMAKSAVRVY
ncbi:sugar phosphate isomerase/epimerase [Bacillus sp. JCM 19041]|uniref:sugar phosphate isomerase/epimerase family protein n=1 Tax=Bacillus sp. JCM 19041 TaxID=1460637 RepID=UPI0006D0CA29